MIINHNIPALNIYRHFNEISENNAKTTEKLASGLRINKASDDSAGFSISEKMRAQIRGLNQAQRNIQDGLSLIQTVDGALGEVNSVLLRMRELSFQASNGLLLDEDRKLIQDEVGQLLTEVDSIARCTQFNGIKLLDGSNVKTTPGSVSLNTVTASITDPNARVAAVIFDSNVNFSQSFVIGLSAAPFGTNTSYNALFTFNANPSNPNILYSPLGADTNETLDNLIATFNNIKNDASGDALMTLHKDFINNNNIEFTRYGIDAIVIKHSPTSDFTVINGGSDGSGIMPGTTWVEKGYTADFTYHQVQTSTPTSNIIDTKLQTGPNINNTFKIRLANVKSSVIGIEPIDVSTEYTAHGAITLIDNAIRIVTSERTKFGAYQNALEHLCKNVENSSENLTASESRIRDADMAKEMVSFAKNKILKETSQALLAQANHSHENILSLLR